jgi:hypothetical protein
LAAAAANPRLRAAAHSAKLKEQPPPVFSVKVATTKVTSWWGHRDWALTRRSFLQPGEGGLFDKVKFFRTISDFIGHSSASAATRRFSRA